MFSEPLKDYNQASDQRILIVDDDRITTHILSGILENAGYRTLSAHDLATAKRIVSNYSISLILLDVNLPDGNGLDFCANILQKQNLKGLPVLFISASDDHELKVRGFESGGVDYITKPLVGAEVLARVRTHLRLKMAYEQLARLHAERIERLTENQLSLLPDPEKMPQAGFYASVRQVLNAGGDFYDVVMHGDKITDYVVSDASGHDLGSTIWTASFKTLWTEFSKLVNMPSDICLILNDSLLRIFTATCIRHHVWLRGSIALWADLPW
jgi:sigma-B regulation protein RsbU (phosphoserine phosphatase)